MFVVRGWLSVVNSLLTNKTTVNYLYFAGAGFLPAPKAVVISIKTSCWINFHTGHLTLTKRGPGS
jgi:hypothetical protein